VEWKPYYQEECEADGARAAIDAWLVADFAVSRLVGRRAVLSFPHTALRYAGPLQARVARALYDDRTVERILALGVLHGSGIEVYRAALDAGAPAGRRREAFAAVGGAFLPREKCVETPFGELPAWDTAVTSAVRIDEAGLLGAEFSLDTFHGVLRAAADAFGRPPLPVLSVYVGVTRDPLSGSFETAEAVADWMRAYIDPSTAVVATGDLVHYGAAYGGAWAPGNPVARGALEKVLRPEVERVLASAFADRDWETAYRLSRERLGNDQREMLAVLSSHLGPGAWAALLSFDLSDYSEILNVAPPCVVASALAAYDRAP
jgi:hypothetical protein